MRPLFAAIALASLFAARGAHAQEEPKPEPQKAVEVDLLSQPGESKPSAEAPKPRPPVPVGESPARRLPDYDPRGPEKTSVGDVLIWVPRVVLAPFYLVHEYVVREPLGYLATTAERKHWQVKVYDFLTTENHKAGIFPTAYVDFGVKPAVGFYAFADDFIVDNNDVRLHFGTWGPKWLNVAVTDRVRLHNGATIAAIASLYRHSDALFFGIGPRTTNDTKSRFNEKIVDFAAEYYVPFSVWSFLRTRAGFRQGRFEDRGCCGVDLADRVAAGELSLPPGFDGYDIGYQAANLTIDSRTRKPVPGSGVRVELLGETAQQIQGSGRSWVRYGGTVGGFLDVGRMRTVGLKAMVGFADPLHGSDIPFTEQIVLGGNRQMRGFLPGRMVDRSGAILELEYTWPVWIWLDGTFRASLGNVFGEHLQDFSTKLLRLSTGIGLRSKGNPDSAFELFTGIGTETFEDGFKVTSFRFVIGNVRGF